MRRRQNVAVSFSGGWWLYRGAQSLKNAPSAIVARYEGGARHSSRVRGLYWEQLQVGHRGAGRGPGSSRGATDGRAMNLAGWLY